MTLPVGNCYIQLEITVVLLTRWDPALAAFPVPQLPHLKNGERVIEAYCEVLMRMHALSVVVIIVFLWPNSLRFKSWLRPCVSLGK